MISDTYEQEMKVTSSDPNDSSKSMEKSALIAAEHIGARVYTIKHQQKTPLHFFVMGCQGTGKNAQKDVARLMNEFAADSEHRAPAFVLVLGDNMYDHGVSSPADDAFNSCFNQMYADDQLPAIAQVPFFLILGNHDANRHRLRLLKNGSYAPEQLEMAQVAHTYMGDVATKKQRFSQEELVLESLDKWNMPYLYYSLIVDDTQIFCLNSNTYAKDWLDWHNGVINLNKRNQAEWLQSVFAEAQSTNRQTIFALHHPPYTTGKRAIPSGYDAHHYLSHEQINDIQKKLGIETKSYNEILLAIFKSQQCQPKMYFVAHDHTLAYYHNDLSGKDAFCQVTCGGGGGDLQSRKIFDKQNQVGCYLKHHGFVAITRTPTASQEFIIEYHSTHKQYLVFNNKQHQAMHPMNEGPYADLRALMLATCDDYFALKATHKLESEMEAKGAKEEKHQSYLNYFSHVMTTVSKSIYAYMSTYDDVDCVHDLMALFNNPEIIDIQEVAPPFYDIVSKFSDPQVATFFNEKFTHFLESRAINIASMPTHTPTL